MPAEILDGRALAQKVRLQVAEDVAALTDQTGVVPGLTVVLVGDDPASKVYVRNKETACKAAGMNGIRHPPTRRDDSGTTPGHNRPPECRSGCSWHPRAAPAAEVDRRGGRGRAG